MLFFVVDCRFGCFIVCMYSYIVHYSRWLFFTRRCCYSLHIQRPRDTFKNSLLRCRGCNSCRDFKYVPVVNDSEPAFKIPCSAVDAVTVVRIPWFGTALRIPCSAVEAVTAVRIPCPTSCWRRQSLHSGKLYCHWKSFHSFLKRRKKLKTQT